jgi:hypothetical protein
MYNTAFIAHNILRIASQDTGLHCFMKISYLTDCEAVWNLFYIQANFKSSSLLASHALPICVPAGFLYLLWTYSFPSDAVEA